MKHLGIAFILALAVLCFAVWPSSAAADEEPSGKLYVVAISHLDTQYLWDINETILFLIPSTFQGSFNQLDDYPDYRFSWEGSFRYRLLEEYNPDIHEELQAYMDSGQWSPAGGSVEGGDVNIPSPEALIRQFLYGNRYFRSRYGRESLDVFLPDCFGFAYSLPSIAAHCGRIGFSTAKLEIMETAVDLPFAIGVWEGPDGHSIVASLKNGHYRDQIESDLSNDPEVLARIEQQRQQSGLDLAMMYFGTGDSGGSVNRDSLEKLQESINGDGPVEVISAASDQLFRDLDENDIAALPIYKGELLLSTHGTGTLTSQSALKLWNRQNEALAQAAERLSVIADWMKTQPYPKDAIDEAWMRVLNQHFHDNLTGTSIPQALRFSWNDERVAQNRFATLISGGMGAVAQVLDTNVEGKPLAVYNTLAFDREEAVTALVRYNTSAPQAVRVFDPDGKEVPSQMQVVSDTVLEVTFVAAIPSVGVVVYDVRESETPCEMSKGLQASENALENDRYRLELDGNGNIASLFDKNTEQEFLAAPVALQILDDRPDRYPAWEIRYEDVSAAPRSVVSAPAQVRVTRNGPALVEVEVTRHAGDSTFVEKIGLGAGSSMAFPLIDYAIDWQTLGSLLKLSVTFPTDAAQATYDLGLGVIERPVNTERLYEAPAQQWADLSNKDKSRGLTVINDSRYGWDRPSENELRLTLLHTPTGEPDSDRKFQYLQDLGSHTLRTALFPHTGDWLDDSVRAAAVVNRPLLVAQLSKHAGDLGRHASFLQLDHTGLQLMAMKAAEDGNGYVLRLRETQNRTLSGVALTMGDGISAAWELDGEERELNSLDVDNGKLLLDFKPFELRTMRVNLVSSMIESDPSSSRSVELSFDSDVVSLDANRADGGFDETTDSAYPGEQWPDKVTVMGVQFKLGSSVEGENNALSCKGQTITIDPVPGERLYLLAAASEAVEESFIIDGQSFPLHIGAFDAWIGQWHSLVVNGEVVENPEDIAPGFLNLDPIAFYTTHRHLPYMNEPYAFGSVYIYELPVPDGARTLQLPNNPTIRIFALSIADNPVGDATPAMELFDGFDPLEWPHIEVVRPASSNLPDGDEDIDNMEGNGDKDNAAISDEGGDGCHQVSSNELLPFGLFLWAFLCMIRAIRLRGDVQRRKLTDSHGQSD